MHEMQLLRLIWLRMSFNFLLRDEFRLKRHCPIGILFRIAMCETCRNTRPVSVLYQSYESGAMDIVSILARFFIISE